MVRGGSERLRRDGTAETAARTSGGLLRTRPNSEQAGGGRIPGYVR
ncbi:hypothetical protein [Parasphingorhabdus pacifica]